MLLEVHCIVFAHVFVDNFMQFLSTAILVFIYKVTTILISAFLQLLKNGFRLRLNATTIRFVECSAGVSINRNLFLITNYNVLIILLFSGTNHPMKPHRIAVTHNLVLSYQLHKKMKVIN